MLLRTRIKKKGVYTPGTYELRVFVDKPCEEHLDFTEIKIKIVPCVVSVTTPICEFSLSWNESALLELEEGDLLTVKSSSRLKFKLVSVDTETDEDEDDEDDYDDEDDDDYDDEDDDDDCDAVKEGIKSLPELNVSFNRSVLESKSFKFLMKHPYFDGDNSAENEKRAEEILKCITFRFNPKLAYGNFDREGFEIPALICTAGPKFGKVDYNISCIGKTVQNCIDMLKNNILFHYGFDGISKNATE